MSPVPTEGEIEANSIIDGSLTNEVLIDDDTSSLTVAQRIVDDISKDIKRGKLTLQQKVGKSDIWQRFSRVFDGKVDLNFVQCSKVRKFLNIQRQLEIAI